MAAEGQPSAGSTILRFAEFEADLRTGELRKRGLRLKLQEKPFQILALLLERKGELVTREELQVKLWPSDTFVDFDHGLNAAVNKLREALGDSASEPRFIETLPKRGYRFVFEIGPKDQEAPKALTSASSARGSKDSHNADPMMPRPARIIPRTLLLLAQAMYLCFYISALAGAQLLAGDAAAVFGRFNSAAAEIAFLTAVIGIPVRLYLLAAIAFDVRALRGQFRLLFPFLFLWDELWALSPLLLWRELGYGLAFAAVAALVWMPFAQRTLIRMAYLAADEAEESV